MEYVSYQQRDCRDRTKIERFLTESRTGILGIGGDEYPYAVPVNFVWHRGSLYFHGMGSGKKMRLLAQHPAVCFTIYREDGTVIDPVPCHADTAYLSVMLFGAAERVDDPGEAAEALQKILDKYTPLYYRRPISARLAEKYQSDLDGNGVAVYRIKPVYVTAKENTANPGDLFGAGSP